MKVYLPVAVIAAALMAASCGVYRSAGLPIQQAASHLSSQQTLAELEAMAAPEGVDGALWAELKEALEAAFLSREESRFSNRDSLSTESRLESRDSGGGKFVSTPPAGEANRVNDLAIADNGDGTYTLTWHYRNLGDYDQDGVVGIADITPLAQHFGETYDIETEPNSIQAVIDGSGNGKVDIADVTPIAQNFGIEVADYLIEGAMALEGPFSEVETVSVGEATGAETGRAVFTDAFTPGEYTYFRVTARDGAGTPGEPSNTVGIALQILSVSPTEVKEGTVVTFSAEVLGAGPLSYEWDFGGGAQYETYTGPSPRVALTRDTGGFPATLTVANPVGNDTYPFTLTKLAREWKYEVVLSTDKEYEEVRTKGLCEHQRTLYFFAYINDVQAITTVARYLVSGTPSNWSFESDPPIGILRLNSEGTLGSLRAAGSFMNTSLLLWEKANGSWTSETIVTGRSLPGEDFAYANDDVPFVAYIYRYSVPELTVDLRYARRVEGEWLYGVIDDAGGPGGEIQTPIIMRIDPEGNPAVAYRAAVEDRKELRLARWSPATEDWEWEQVIADLCSQYDLSFDRQGRPCFIFADYGSTTDTLAVYYGSLDRGALEQEIIEEWPKEEVINALSSFNLAYDPLGNPLVAAYIGDAQSRVWWHDGTAWEAATDLSGTYFRTGIDGGPNQLSFFVTAAGTPHITFAASQNWDDGPKEVMLVSYE